MGHKFYFPISIFHPTDECNDIFGIILNVTSLKLNILKYNLKHTILNVKSLELYILKYNLKQRLKVKV